MVAIKHFALGLILVALSFSNGRAGPAVSGARQRLISVCAVRRGGAGPRFSQPRHFFSAAGCSYRPGAGLALGPSRRAHSHGIAAQAFHRPRLRRATRLSLSEAHLSRNIHGMLASTWTRCRRSYRRHRTLLQLILPRADCRSERGRCLSDCNPFRAWSAPAQKRPVRNLLALELAGGRPRCAWLAPTSNWFAAASSPA